MDPGPTGAPQGLVGVGLGAEGAALMVGVAVVLEAAAVVGAALVAGAVAGAAAAGAAVAGSSPDAAGAGVAAATAPFFTARHRFESSAWR